MQMIGQEMIVAEREVTIDWRHTLSVRISEDQGEGFWRVEVTNPVTHRHMSSTTVGGGDNFVWHLIQSAVDGDVGAWHQLASWGHGVMVRPQMGLRVSA